jgi:hypothetical protein
MTNLSGKFGLYDETKTTCKLGSTFTKRREGLASLYLNEFRWSGHRRTAAGVNNMNSALQLTTRGSYSYARSRSRGTTCVIFGRSGRISWASEGWRRRRITDLHPSRITDHELIKANAELVNCSMKQPRRTRTDHTVPFQEAAAFMFTSAWRTRGVTWQGLPFSVLTTRVVFFSPPLFTFQWFVPPPSCWGGRSQEFYIGGAKFEFFLQSHSYSHILSQLHVLTSFTYIFGFHLGQNKKSYEAIKYGYMNSFNIRCRWFRNFFDS